MNRSDTDDRDAAALARCAGGDPRAVDSLYEQHGAACLSLARSILVDPHLAEDAVQEAYLDLWRHADRFDGRRSSVRGWLLLLTRRRAVDRVRAEQRRTTSALGAEHDRPDDGPTPDAQAVTALLAEQAQEALAALPQAKREAIVLAYWGGYTQREIAALTDTPLGTVKTRMFDGMKALSATLLTDTSRRPGAVRACAAASGVGRRTPS